MTSLFTLVLYYWISTFQKNKLTEYSSLARNVWDYQPNSAFCSVQTGLGNLGFLDYLP